MQPSFMRTITAPAAPTTNPARLANATDVPLRLVLRVVVGGTAALAYSVNDLTPEISSESFEIDLDAIIVLAPRQAVYAVGVAAPVRLSIAASEAYPVL